MTTPPFDDPPASDTSQYYNKPLQAIIYDYGSVRGDLVEPYAREQMRQAILHSHEVNYFRNAMRLAQQKRAQAEKRQDQAEIEMSKFRTQLIQANASRNFYRTDARVFVVLFLIMAVVAGTALWMLSS
jgi:hypothetical protein